MTTPKPRSLDRYFFLRLVGTLLALALLIYLLREQGWEEIGAAIGAIPVWNLLLAFLLTIVSRLAVSLRWHILIHAIEPRTSLAQALRLTFAGLFASNFLPTTIGGDVVRLAGAIQLKLDGVLCAASLVMDRLIGTAGMLMVLPFGLPKFFASQLFTQFGHFAAFESVPLVGLTASSPTTLPGKLLKIARQAFKKILAALSHWISHPAALLQALLVTWIHMLCLFWTIYLLLGGMKEEISFWLIAGLWGIIYFITLIPISINGYGVQELSATFIFTQIGGISPQHSLTLALLIRTLQMAISLPGALFVSSVIVGARGEPA